MELMFSLLLLFILSWDRVAAQPLPPYPYPAPPAYPIQVVPVPQGAQLGMIISTHRHGVRTPIPAGNNSHCTDIGCGELTFNGKVMLSNLGQFFADMYGIGGKGLFGTSPLNNGDGLIPANAATAAAAAPSSPSVNITRYDPRSTRVIATSYDRAIQSGVGVVQGLYTSVTSQKGCGSFGLNNDADGAVCSTPADLVYPLINNDPNDALLYATNTNPSFLVFQQAYNATMYPFMGNLTLRLFTPSELLVMSQEMSMTTGECDDNSTGLKPSAPLPGSRTYDPYSCGLDLQDEMRYLYATKGSQWLATNMPTVFANIARLDACLNLFSYYYLYGYDANEVANQTDTSGLIPILPLDTNAGVRGLSVNEAAGYLCYPLAMAMITDMKTMQPTYVDEVSGTTLLINPQQAQDQGILRYKDYSAHDMTIMELSNAMGNYTSAAFDAPFAVTLYFEVWVTQAGPSEDVSTRHVRAFYGAPQQDADTNHTYSWTPYTMVCMSSNYTNNEGTAIYAAPNGCPLADWERYMASRGPISPAGICYISDEARALLGCGPEVVLQPSDAIVTNPYPTVEELNRQMCYNYRQMCPQWACARNSGSDYELIAAAGNNNVNSNPFDGITNIPYALDQLSNNCVRRFTTADANALHNKQDKIDTLYKVLYGLIAACVAFVIIMVVMVIGMKRASNRGPKMMHGVNVGEEEEGKGSRYKNGSALDQHSLLR